MALLRKNQPAVVVRASHMGVSGYVVSHLQDTIITTDNRREAMQATWRNLRDLRTAFPKFKFASDLNPDA